MTKKLQLFRSIFDLHWQNFNEKVTFFGFCGRVGKKRRNFGNPVALAEFCLFCTVPGGFASGNAIFGPPLGRSSGKCFAVISGLIRTFGAPQTGPWPGQIWAGSLGSLDSGLDS